MRSAASCQSKVKGHFYVSTMQKYLGKFWRREVVPKRNFRPLGISSWIPAVTHKPKQKGKTHSRIYVKYDLCFRDIPLAFRAQLFSAGNQEQKNKRAYFVPQWSRRGALWEKNELLESHLEPLGITGRVCSFLNCGAAGGRGVWSAARVTVSHDSHPSEIPPAGLEFGDRRRSEFYRS